MENIYDILKKEDRRTNRKKKGKLVLPKIFQFLTTLQTLAVVPNVDKLQW